MAQAGPVVWGRFREPIRQYKAPPACACTEEFYETDPRNDFVRGYALQTVAPLPIAMAHLIAEEDGACTARRCCERMQDYNHYAAIGVLGEILPDAAQLRLAPPDGEGPVRHPGAVRALQPVRERPAPDARRASPRAGRC